LPPAGPDEAKPLDLETLTAKADDRTPVPDEAALSAAAKQIKDLFKAEYDRKKPADVLALATKLFQQAAETKEMAAPRFVLLREARDLAARSGDMTLALQATDELSKGFAVNTLEYRMAVLESMGNLPAFPPLQQRLFDTSLALGETAKRADDYGLAERAVKFARAVSQAMRNNLAIKTAQAQAEQVEELRKQYQDLQGAFETLQKTPQDPEARLAVGKYECLGKGDWDRGLPLLASAGESPLAALARKDLDGAAAAKDREELGNLWWDQAAAVNGLAKAQLQRRAYYWYVRAVPELTGFDYARVDKRIGQLLDQVPGLYYTWDHLDTSQVQMVDGVVRLKPGQQLVTKVAYTGPVDITVVARTEKNNIRLHAYKGGSLMFNWEGKQGELKIFRPDNQAGGELGSEAPSKPYPLALNVWHTLRWRLSEKGMDVLVNGQVAFTEPNKYDLSAKKPIRVVATDSVVDVKSFIVRPLQ
jgi:hypothetical protein